MSSTTTAKKPTRALLDALSTEIRTRCSAPVQKQGVESTVRKRLPAAKVHVGVERLEAMNARIVKAKARQRGSDRHIYLRLDSTGKLLTDGGDALEKQNYKLHVKRHGKVTPELADLLSTLKQSRQLRVTFWLRMKSDPGGIGPLDAQGQKRARVSAQKRAVTAARSKFRRELSSNSSLSPKMFDGVHDLPAVRASIPSTLVSQVSRTPVVQKAYWTPDNPPVPAGSAGNAGPDSNSNCEATDTWRASLRSDVAETWSNIDGNGETVCVMDEGDPTHRSQLRIAGDCDDSPSNNDHGAYVAAMISNTSDPNPDGIAPKADVYFGGSNCSERCGGAHIWNRSYLERYSSNNDYWATHSPFPTITLGSGNQENVESCDGVVSWHSWNTLTVGASDDHDSSSLSDDSYAWCTGSKNDNNQDWCPLYLNDCPHSTYCEHGDRELPDLTAIGEDPEVFEFTGSDVWNGTSFSAPQVAGAVALIHQRNNDLRTWPEASRSILMATTWHDVDGAFFDPDDDSIDEADGAGLVDAHMAQRLGRSANRQEESETTYEKDGFDTGQLNFTEDCPEKDSNGGRCSRKYEIAGNDGGTPIRVVFSFNSDPTCTTSDGLSCSENKLTADLDLMIIEKSTGNVVASSTSYDDSNEFVQFVPDPGEDYYAKFKRWETNSSGTYYGIAWDTRGFYCNDD